MLWITAGLGCDGDTIAMTAATHPSIEEVVLGAPPWTPKANQPFLALANGDDFLKPFHQAVEGKVEHFILVVEGSQSERTQVPILVEGGNVVQAGWQDQGCLDNK